MYNQNDYQQVHYNRQKFSYIIFDSSENQTKLTNEDMPQKFMDNWVKLSFDDIQKRQMKQKGLRPKRYHLSHEESSKSNNHQYIKHFQELEQILLLQNKNLKEHNKFLIQYIHTLTNKNHYLRQNCKKIQFTNKQLSDELVENKKFFDLFKQEYQERIELQELKWQIYIEKLKSQTQMSSQRSLRHQYLGNTCQIQQNIMSSIDCLKNMLQTFDLTNNNSFFQKAKAKDEVTQCQMNKNDKQNVLIYGIISKNYFQEESTNRLQSTVENMKNLI